MLEICAMLNQAERRRFIESALATTKYHAIAPGPYERLLLADFVHGALTIEQVIELLEGHTEGELLSIVLSQGSYFWA
jgi:hypothetical protein